MMKMIFFNCIVTGDKMWVHYKCMTNLKQKLSKDSGNELVPHLQRSLSCLHLLARLCSFFFCVCFFAPALAGRLSITKTRLYNFDPLKPHFYIVKLGFTGVYIIFLIFARKHECEYSLEPPSRGGSNEYPQSMF